MIKIAEKTVRIYDLRQKEVINTCDGCRFGFISDIEIDPKEGKVVKLIVPGPGKLFGMFGREQEYQIPWCSVKKIGDDIILVEIDVEKSLVESDY